MRASRTVIGLLGWVAVWVLVSVGWCLFLAALYWTLRFVHSEFFPSAGPAMALLDRLAFCDAWGGTIGVLSIGGFVLGCASLGRRGVRISRTQVLCVGLAVLVCLILLAWMIVMANLTPMGRA